MIFSWIYLRNCLLCLCSKSARLKLMLSCNAHRKIRFSSWIAGRVGDYSESGEEERESQSVRRERKRISRIHHIFDARLKNNGNKTKFLVVLRLFLAISLVDSCKNNSMIKCLSENDFCNQPNWSGEIFLIESRKSSKANYIQSFYGFCNKTFILGRHFYQSPNALPFVSYLIREAENEDHFNLFWDFFLLLNTFAFYRNPIDVRGVQIGVGWQIASSTITKKFLGEASGSECKSSSREMQILSSLS